MKKIHRPWSGKPFVPGLFALLLSSLFPLLLAHPGHADTSGLVLSYDFSGGGAADTGPCGNHGTTHDTGTGAGLLGDGITFDGSRSYVTVPDSDSLDITDQLTVSVWVKAANLGKGTTQRILQRASGVFGLYISTRGQIVFYADTTNGGGAGWKGVGKAIVENRWTHIACVYDGAALSLYRNGDLVGTRSQSGPIDTTSNPLVLGSTTRGDQQFYEGALDELKLYRTALAREEILEDIQRTLPGLLMAFDLEEGAAADGSGLGNDGTVSDATSVEGISGQALAFNGASSCVRVQNSASLNPQRALTVALWVFPTQLGAGTRRLFQRASGTFGMYLQETTGRLVFYTDTRDAGGAWVSIQEAIPQDEWSFVAGTYDAEAERMALYVNGALVGTAAQTLDADHAGKDLYLGSSNGSGQFFEGRLDEVRLYSVALDADAIQEEYRRVLPEDPPETGVPFGFWGLNGYHSAEGYADVQERLGATIFQVAQEGPNYTVNTFLPVVRDAGLQVTLRLAGDHPSYTTDGSFDIGKWKANLARWQGSGIQEFVDDGTVAWHMILDDITNWSWLHGGNDPTGDELEEMARYSQEILPGLPTFVRQRATVLPVPSAGRYEWLDACLNQYRASDGDASAYAWNEHARALELGLGVMNGMNICDGGNGESGQTGWRPDKFAMSAGEILTYGAALLAVPDLELFLCWEYDGEELWADGVTVGSDYFDQPALQDALHELGAMAAAYGG